MSKSIAIACYSQESLQPFALIVNQLRLFLQNQVATQLLSTVGNGMAAAAAPGEGVFPRVVDLWT